MQSQKRVLPILFATLLLDMIGIGMVIPIIPIIFTDPSSPAFLLQGYSQTWQYIIAGLVTALFGLMQFIAAPILGELSDFYGRKKLLAVGVGVLAISQFFFGIGILAGSIVILLISRAIAGLAGANFSIAQASIADVTEPKDRSKNFGLIGAAFGTGFLLGPILGGWIAHLTGSPASPFWFAGALGVLNLAFLYFFLPETRVTNGEKHHFTIWKGIQNVRAAIRDKDARPVYLASFLTVCGFSFFTSFIGVLLVSRFGMTASGIGTFFGAVGAWVIVTQLGILRVLSRRYNERTILRVSLLVFAFAIALYPFAPTIGVLYILVPLLAIPQGLSLANMTALVSKSVSADKQGAALGINGSLFALAQGVIPIAAGFASGLIGIETPFLAGAILVVIAWSTLFIFKPR